jgi:glucokinase
MGKQCIGIDLGGTFTKFALLDEAQQLHGLFQLPTPGDRGAAGVIEQILIGARRLMETHGLSTSDVVAVGLGSPGPLDLDEGVILGMPNVDDMVNVPIREAVFEGLGIRTQLENDANAAAYGEYLCGRGSGKLDLVMLTLGTGLGSGIIIDAAWSGTVRRPTWRTTPRGGLRRTAATAR